jgi:hypothetical protein
VRIFLVNFAGLVTTLRKLRSLVPFMVQTRTTPHVKTVLQRSRVLKHSVETALVCTEALYASTLLVALFRELNRKPLNPNFYSRQR